MKNTFLKNVIPLLLAILSIQLQSCGGGRRDADIQSDIAAKTQANTNLSGVTATVVDGEVVLTGQCEDEDCREKAEKAIRDIDGVRKVTNNITVTPTIVVTPDDELRENAERIISKYKDVQAGVSNGVITLRGEVKKNKLQQLIMDLNALRPRRIDNELVVK